MYEQAKTFLKEVRMELKKVSWPSREVTIASTWVVIAFCFVFSIYFAVVDLVIGKVIGKFLSL